MDFGMAICERKTGCTVMVGRWEINDVSVLRGRQYDLHGASRIINAVRVFVDHYPRLARENDMVQTPINLIRRRRQPTAEIEYLTHRLTPNTGQFLTALHPGGAIRRAFPHLAAVAHVWHQRTPVDGIAWIVTGAASDEQRALGGFGAAIQRFDEQPVAIIGVKPPSKHHLLSIVHAFDALRLGLRLA